jgi:hypothetical protein
MESVHAATYYQIPVLSRAIVWICPFELCDGHRFNKDSKLDLRVREITTLCRNEAIDFIDRYKWMSAEGGREILPHDRDQYSCEEVPLRQV